jgi:hypothetical protein
VGDRANVFVKDAGVYLYTHWGGEELPGIVADALDRGRSRWGDPAYLARIIFCEMIADDVEGTTGFGISSYMSDNEHPIIVVDTSAQRVGFVGESEENANELMLSWTMDEFIKMRPGF